MPAHPIDLESAFSAHELFFSRTDPRGIIQAGNQVFARVSEYERASMIQQPHNLIRHPDMPKAVFKIFWQGLLENQTMSAYVKNMSSSGKYYWVLATVFPVADGFISIRIKPSSELFQAARKIYADTLAHEKKSGMESAQTYLLKRLTDAGFESYEDFMREALKAELSARFEKAGLGTQPLVAPAHAVSFSHTYQSLEAMKAIFVRMKTAQETSKNFVALAQSVSHSYHQIHLLSINMIAEAERIGEQGRTLTVISETFSKWAKDIQTNIQNFSLALSEVSKEFSKVIFSISTTELQAEMVAFFMQEYFEHLNSREGIRIADEELKQSCDYFFAAPEALFQEVRNHLHSLSAKIYELELANETLRYGLNALKMIRQNGRIETSRLSADQQGYGHHLDGMMQFIGQVEQVSERIGQEGAELKSSVQFVLNELFQVAASFRKAASTLH